ncbi:hypothetical protein WSK_3023 [Novosphingobium sp. Rr 2-17]|uniref:diacylglycerol kinase family protein n=1 Tax=Novosphingobium sp. Rr 2-17 TaxID=555793 RepID=UPI000269AB7B|nr:diacylglycerol kinase family protein [Novosphingobium sp. Rr 2-17]EIZ78404.1 hypothetical protein WSK_3023 [Novosphingobium sp. Rr 2-17]
MTGSAPPFAKLWFVCNPSSGSNDDAVVDELLAAFTRIGLAPDRVVRFPDDPAPSPQELDAAGVDLLAVFAGDGTTHSVVTGAYGWGGGVLVLPGGTMNLLAKRLHGDFPALDIIPRLASGAPLSRVRPKVVRGRLGDGLTGALIGPGAVWNDVREAMRAASIVEFFTTAREAISYSANGPRVLCADADCGREEGYVAISVVPHEDGLEANGFYAESLGDYAGQGIALLSRNFRNGPHDELGRHSSLRLVSSTGAPMGMLMDGESRDGEAEERFELATCEVDLILTRPEETIGDGTTDAR